MLPYCYPFDCLQLRTVPRGRIIIITLLRANRSYCVTGASFAIAIGITSFPFRLASKFASRASVALFFISGVKWLYRSVIVKVLCPKSSLIVKVGVPCIASQEPEVMAQGIKNYPLPSIGNCIVESRQEGVNSLYFDSAAKPPGFEIEKT